MAATVEIVKRRNLGDAYAVVADVTLDDAYAAGGYALTPSDFGLTAEIDFLVGSPHLGVTPEWDYANEKLKAMVQGIDTDAAGAGTLDDLPVTQGVGTTVASVGLTAADPRFGGLKEAPTSEDMSTITCRVVVFGY